MQPTCRVESVAVREDALVVVKQAVAHAERDIGRDRVVFVLYGNFGGDTWETLGNAVTESERYSRSKDG